MNTDLLEPAATAEPAKPPAARELPPRPADMAWEYILRGVVVILGMVLGLFLAVFLGLVLGWIPIC